MKTALHLLFLLALFACRAPNSHNLEKDPHEDHGTEAVLEASPEKGFRLAPQALRTLGIETISLKRGDPAELPTSALVYFQDEIGVYRLREDWFRLIPLDLPGELRPGDSVTIRGAGFLRVTDMSLFGEQSSGHHH